MAIKIRTTGLENYLEGGQSYIKALIIGRPKAGKTRSAAFWPKPFFLDFDEGVMSVSDLAVPYVGIVGDGAMRKTDDVLEVLDMLKRDSAQGEQHRKYKTMVIDTLDAFQRMAIQERLVMTGRPGLSGWEDWGWLDAKMQAFMTRVLNYKGHVVCNVHIKTSETDDVVTNAPKLKGDMRDSISADFSLVGHMVAEWEAVEGERHLVRRIRWTPVPGFEVLGDRSGTFPDATPVNFAPSDFQQLMDLFAAKAAEIKPGEQTDSIEQPEPAQPAPPDVTGGPVAPKSTSVTAPAAKKAAAAPEPKPDPSQGTPGAPAAPVAPAAPAAPAAPPMVVEEGSGAESVPAASTPAEATTPVLADNSAEPSVEQAVATVQETLGGTVVSETDTADAPKAAPSADGEPPLICGSPGPLKDGQTNPAPIDGCGGNIREIASSQEDKDRVNVAFMKTRTFVCPPCYAAYEATRTAAAAS